MEILKVGRVTPLRKIRFKLAKKISLLEEQPLKKPKRQRKKTGSNVGNHVCSGFQIQLTEFQGFS